MHYQRILTIQDISCVGQCSMTVALPILSACGHEVCILPSAVLSTHTGGFGAPVVQNLTACMEPIRHHWQHQGITFDAIYTGYLGSTDAVHAASDIIAEMLAPGGKVIIDPAMADHGKIYSGLTEDYAKAMIDLCARANVVLPNVTEAAMMAGLPYRESFDEAYIQQLLNGIHGKNIVLTGVGFEPGKTGAAIRSGDDISYYFHDRLSRNFSGTGDIFASAFTGALMQGRTLTAAARIAADYTSQCIQNTIENPAHWYGVKFESALPDLIAMLK